MDLHYHSNRLKTVREPRLFHFSSPVVSGKATSVETLLLLASQGKSLPSLKTYSYTPQACKDLSVPVVDVNSYSVAVQYARQQELYDHLKGVYDKETQEAEHAKQQADAEQALREQVKQELASSSSASSAS